MAFKGCVAAILDHLVPQSPWAVPEQVSHRRRNPLQTFQTTFPADELHFLFTKLVPVRMKFPPLRTFREQFPYCEHLWGGVPASAFFRQQAPTACPEACRRSASV